MSKKNGITYLQDGTRLYDTDYIIDEFKFAHSYFYNTKQNMKSWGQMYVDRALDSFLFNIHIANEERFNLYADIKSYVKEYNLYEQFKIYNESLEEFEAIIDEIAESYTKTKRFLDDIQKRGE